jgi:hypothetical protein
MPAQAGIQSTFPGAVRVGRLVGAAREISSRLHVLKLDAQPESGGCRDADIVVLDLGLRRPDQGWHEKGINHSHPEGVASIGSG